MIAGALQEALLARRGDGTARWARSTSPPPLGRLRELVAPAGRAMLLITGPHGAGRTALALVSALAADAAGVRVSFVSTRDDPQVLRVRLEAQASSLSGSDPTRIRLHLLDGLSMVAGAGELVRAGELLVVDCSARCADGIQRLRNAADRLGAGLVLTCPYTGFGPPLGLSPMFERVLTITSRADRRRVVEAVKDSYSPVPLGKVELRVLDDGSIVDHPGRMEDDTRTPCWPQVR